LRAAGRGVPEQLANSVTSELRGWLRLRRLVRAASEPTVAVEPVGTIVAQARTSLAGQPAESSADPVILLRTWRVASEPAVQSERVDGALRDSRRGKEARA